MSIRGQAFIAGAYEHPLREIPDLSSSQIQAECAVAALADAGLTFADVDGYFTDSAHGLGGFSMADYLGLRLSHVDSTETGGSSYLVHVGHAAEAIAAGKCSVALVTMAGRPRSIGMRAAQPVEPVPDAVFEGPWGLSGAVTGYAMAAARHMYQYGTTSEQLAEVKVAASIHARHNPNAFLRKPVTVEQVLASPMVSSPLHRDDCCVVTDGGGAVVVVGPEVAASLSRTCTVYTFTVVHRSVVPGYREAVPYAVGYVELAEGPRVMTNIVDVDPAEVSIGMPVSVVFTDTGEGSALYRFKPA